MTPLVFEDMFFGDYNALITLTQQRQAAAVAAAALDANDATRIDEHVAALQQYATAWRTFVREYVYDRGSVARTRLPFEVSWSVSLVSPTPTTYTDGSPLLETACATLAYVAALQRAGAVTGVGLDTAVAELETLHDSVLEPFFLPQSSHPESSRDAPRASPVLSTVLCRALAAAIAGQARVKTAVAALQAGTHDASAMTAALFGARESFSRSLAALPTTQAFRDAHRAVSALAHRYAAEALVDVPDDATRGVAVTLARAAHRIHPTNTAVQKYAAELDDRNQIEFGMQTVPSWESIAIAIDASVARVEARKTDTGWRVLVPRV